MENYFKRKSESTISSLSNDNTKLNLLNLVSKFLYLFVPPLDSNPESLDGPFFFHHSKCLPRKSS